MDEEKALPNTARNGATQQAPTQARRGLISPRMLSFRSSSAPLLSPTEIYERHVKEKHESSRPPLLRPESIIPKQMANTNYREITPLPDHDKLGNFRRLVGIDSDAAHTVGGDYNRPAENVGIYMQVVREEIRSRAQYKRFSILINSSLGLQIIFAAAITALGAGNGPNTAVTVFGAINTVIASILTFLKGSGLPNREKYYANEWKKLRDYIEQRERDFGRHNCPLNVDEEIHRIEVMYTEVKEDIEANTPDGYKSVTQAKKLASLAAALPYPGKNRTPDHLDEKSGVNGNPHSPNGGSTLGNPAMTAAPNLEAGTLSYPSLNPSTQAPTAGPSSGIGLGSGGPSIAAPYIPPPPQAHFPFQNDDNLLGKRADRLSGIAGGASSAGNGTEKAHNVLETITRLSHKFGADGILDHLKHLDHTHKSASAAGAETEQRLAASARGLSVRGEDVARQAEAGLEGQIQGFAGRLMHMGRDAEARGRDLASEVEGRVGGIREEVVGRGQRMEREGEGYFRGVSGGLEREAERLRDAGVRAQEKGKEIERTVGEMGMGMERGVEGVGGDVRAAMEGGSS